MTIGLLSIVYASLLTYQRTSPNRLSFAKPIASTGQTSINTAKPNRLIIEELGVDIPITAGQIDGNKWPLSPTGAIYLSESAVPGEQGNAVIYGHNWKSILGELHLIKPGNIIEIINENGKVIVYRVTTIQVVEKTQSSVLNNSEDQRITLYTCTGFLDQKRLVVTALLAS